MTVERKEIVAFFENLEGLEEAKKVIAGEIKDNIEAFASNLEVNKKSLRKAYKEWKEWKKNQAEFVEVDYESDELLTKAVPEMATTAEGN